MTTYCIIALFLVISWLDNFWPADAFLSSSSRFCSRAHQREIYNESPRIAITNIPDRGNLISLNAKRNTVGEGKDNSTPEEEGPKKARKVKPIEGDVSGISAESSSTRMRKSKVSSSGVNDKFVSAALLANIDEDIAKFEASLGDFDIDDELDLDILKTDMDDLQAVLDGMDKDEESSNQEKKQKKVKKSKALKSSKSALGSLTDNNSMIESTTNAVSAFNFNFGSLQSKAEAILGKKSYTSVPSVESEMKAGVETPFVDSVKMPQSSTKPVESIGKRQPKSRKAADAAMQRAEEPLLEPLEEDIDDFNLDSILSEFYSSSDAAPGRSDNTGSADKVYDVDNVELEKMARLLEQKEFELSQTEGSSSIKILRENLNLDTLEHFDFSMLGVLADDVDGLDKLENEGLLDTPEEGGIAVVDDSSPPIGEGLEKPLIIDGVTLDRKEFKLGAEPPLEEFRRLMESLGPDSLFGDDDLFGDDEDLLDDEDALNEAEYMAQLESEAKKDNVVFTPSEDERPWIPYVYEGGRPGRPVPKNEETLESFKDWLVGQNQPNPYRVQIISAITNSSTNSTALEMVRKVYDFLRVGTNNDSRIEYQILCYVKQNEISGEESAVEELDDIIQMWLESYNTYHLIDGFAMKEAWGAIMPHIVLSDKNLNAILDQVRWALLEDENEGAILTPRLRQLRLGGGAEKIKMGFNTEEIDNEFSVVSVR